MKPSCDASAVHTSTLTLNAKDTIWGNNQHDLIKVLNWSKNNMLVANPSKFQEMLSLEEISSASGNNNWKCNC